MPSADWTPRYLALNTIFRTIAVKRRRALLYRLLAGPEPQPVALSELISFVALWETLDKTGSRTESQATGTGTDEHRSHIATSVLHRHLPYLADQAIIEYDSRNDTVIATDRGRDLEPLLAVTKHAEHAFEAD